MTYSHMGRPHTTIGAEPFHYRVRKGIGWDRHAMVVRQFCRPAAFWQRVKIGIMLIDTSTHSCDANHLGVIWSSLTGN